jgi:hypothetical protein
MTKGGNGNTRLTASAILGLDGIEHRLDRLLRHFRTAPVPTEVLTDAIGVLTDLQAELAASIAAPTSYDLVPPRAPRPAPRASAVAADRELAHPSHAAV